jgi:hypothetical protein
MKPIKLLIVLATQMTLMFTATQLHAQSLAYSNAIVALNPVGYWPMHETAAPAPADIETNYGSLGALGAAYYADWWENNDAPGNIEVIHNYPGPLQNVPNGAVYLRDAYTSPDPTNTSWALVPHTSPLTVLAPPFTIEAWVYGSNGDFGDIVGIDGTALNGGNDNNGYGFRFSWGGGSVGNIFQSYIEGYSGTAGTTAVTTNAWHYAVLVSTINAGNTNYTVYVDGGVYQASANSGYKPDYWDPLLIGGGMWNNTGSVRNRDMGLADVAIYTNTLSPSDITNKWYIATNTISGPNDYYNAVINDNPVLFYHMDSPSFQGWAPTNTWPVLNNYGSVATNGVYMPGVTPGGVAGPIFSGEITNAMPGNGLSAFADVGPVAANPALNPTGTTHFSVTACFRGNPADSRLESLVGHGDNSWHLRLDTSGKLHFGTGAQASDVISSSVYNDGLWHVVVGVYDGHTNYLYVDGAVAVSAANATAIIGTNTDVLVGSDPQYVNINNGAGMQFSGDLCDVAFFNNVLTAAQVKSLFNIIGAPVTIISSPVLSRVGNSNVFTVTANGSSPAYQWYYNTANSYSGATGLTDIGGVSGSATPSVTIANLNDYYFAVATNAFGSVTSSIVQVPQLNVVAAGEPIWNTNTASQTNIMVIFSVPLDPVTSVLVGNYTLNNGASVSSAVLVASNEVALTTSILNSMTSYTLTVQNVSNIYSVALLPSPTNLTVGVYPDNLALWVKADTGVTTNVNGVSQWNDLSGNNNDLSTVSGIEPQLVTNAYGDVAIRFTATNDTQMDASSSPSLAITGDLSIMAVINFVAVGTNGEICSKTGSGLQENIPAPYDYAVAGSANPNFLRGNGGSLGAGKSYGSFATAANAVSVGKPQILAVSDMGNTVSDYVNGLLAGTGLLGSSYQETSDADIGNDFTIGARTDGVNRLTGDLSELIVVGSAISSYDVAELDAYLAAKYNVVLFNSNPTNIVFSASGGNLTLKWPLDHTGWQLQAQTNSVSVGISTNWVNVSGSTSTNQVVFPVNLTKGTVFYRLIYP